MIPQDRRPHRIVRPAPRVPSREAIQILVDPTHGVLTIGQDYDCSSSLARAKTVVRELDGTDLAALPSGPRRIRWEDIPRDTRFP